MLVAVWNNCKTDKSRELATLLALSGVNNHQTSVALFENNVKGSLLGDMLIDRRYSQILREDGMRYVARSEVGRSRMFIENRYKRRCYGENLVMLIDNALYYGVQYNDENENVYNDNIGMRYTEFLAEAEKRTDYQLIATDRGENASSLQIVDDADKVVVAITPEDYDFNKFFDNYRMIRYKCIFVLVSDEKISKKEKDHFKSVFGLVGSQLFEFVETEEFKDYAAMAKVMEYAKKYTRPTRASSEYALYRQIEKISAVVFNGIVPTK